MECNNERGLLLLLTGYKILYNMFYKWKKLFSTSWNVWLWMFIVFIKKMWIVKQWPGLISKFRKKKVRIISDAGCEWMKKKMVRVFELDFLNESRPHLVKLTQKNLRNCVECSTKNKKKDSIWFLYNEKKDFIQLVLSVSIVNINVLHTKSYF